MIKESILTLAALLALAPVGNAQLEWDKRKVDQPLANPSAVRVEREQTLEIVRAVLAHNEITVKSSTCDDRSGVCTIVTEPSVFTRGIVADSQFDHVAELGATDVRHVVRGRVALRVEVTPTNPRASSVGIYGTFDGLVEGATGSEWVVSRSRGVLEDRLMREVVAAASGEPPPARDRDDEPTVDEPTPATPKKP